MAGMLVMGLEGQGSLRTKQDLTTQYYYSGYVTTGTSGRKAGDGIGRTG